MSSVIFCSIYRIGWDYFFFLKWKKASVAYLEHFYHLTCSDFFSICIPFLFKTKGENLREKLFPGILFWRLVSFSREENPIAIFHGIIF